MEWIGAQWIGGVSGVEWIGEVKWSGSEWIGGVECSGVEQSGSVERNGSVECIEWSAVE